MKFSTLVSLCLAPLVVGCIDGAVELGETADEVTAQNGLPAISPPWSELVAYDLNEPLVVSQLEKLGNRLNVIIDDEGAHGANDSSETEAAKRLTASASRPREPLRGVRGP